MKLLTGIILLSMLLLIPINVQAYGSYYEDEISAGLSEYNITFLTFPDYETVNHTVARNINATTFKITLTGHTRENSENQHTPNATDIDGTCQGATACNKAYDNSYATCPFASLGTETYWYFNYTKPTPLYGGNLTGATWKFFTWGVDIYYIDMLDYPDCWAQDPLQFKATSDDIGTDQARWDCYDGTTWVNVRTVSSYNAVCEEDIFWMVDYYPYNITVDYLDDGTIEYNNTGVFNYSADVYFNTTSLNDHLRYDCTEDWTGDCNISINYTSVTASILEINDTNITGDYVYGLYNFSLYTEDNWDAMFDVTGLNVTLILYCENGNQINYNISNNTYDEVIIHCDLQSASVEIDYPGDKYVREILSPGTAWNYDIGFYMVDATVDTLLQMPIYMDDVNYRSATLELYKTVENVHYTIHSGYFDIENKLLTYLKKDSKYNLRIVRGTETRDINYLYAYAATAQHISLNQISIAPSIRLISDNILMGADFINQSAPNTTLRITYEDLINMTEDVRIRVFSDINNTPFFDQTYTSSNFTISLLEINTSFRYSVHWLVNHAVLGNSPIPYTIGVGGRPGWDLGLPADLEWLYIAFSFFIVMATSWIITPENRFPGYILLLVELAILGIGQWATFGTAPLALFITFIVAGIIYEIRHKGVS